MLRWTASYSRTAARRAKADGNWSLAAHHYRMAVKRDPRRAGTWVQYGNALRECGKAAEAEAAYRKALDLAADDPDAHVQFGHLLKQQGRRDEAIAEYLGALECDPWLLHASQELIDLGCTSHIQRPSSAKRRASTAAEPPTAAVVIDAGDLLLHFLHSRLPTGIQRVQLEIIASLLAMPAAAFQLIVACFAPHRDLWVDVPEDLFLTLAGLAAGGGALDERPWQKAVLELTAVLAHGDPVEFPAGAVLVNLGASWSHRNYFLALRNAKARDGIRFIPFVHDCIPLLMPDLCVEATVRAYKDWLLGLFLHADGYLVNSKSTRTDLSNVAARLGHSIPPPEVIPLDGRFSARIGAAPPQRRENRRLVWQRSVKPFVLLVSTFEPRKNHKLAFGLWLKLIEKRGMRRTPALVCVGHRGWKTEEAMSLLRSSKALRRQVRLLTEITDARLAELYDDCLFTLYPSVYEGWGLPVTESLCHRKVPLISRVSALPEAGGEFAEYFDRDSLEDLLTKTERLIDDRDYRASREALIEQKFRPRDWSAIAGQVIDYALGWRRTTAVVACSPVAELGRFYPIARSDRSRIRPGMIAGEVFRTGEGWWGPEEWGCWLKSGHADIAFSLPQCAARVCLLYVGLRGLPTRPTDFWLSNRANRVVSAGTIGPNQYRWPALRIETGAISGGMIRLRVTSNGQDDLAQISGGADRRIVTLGILGFYLCGAEDSSRLPEFVLKCEPPMPIETPVSDRDKIDAD